MTEQQKKVAFQLFIIEGELTQETFDIYMSGNSKFSQVLSDLTFEQINEYNLATAKEINKEIRYDIY